MLGLVNRGAPRIPSLDRFDRFVIAYLTLPLAIFLIGWFEWWVAVPLLACAAYALLPLWSRRADDDFRFTRLQLVMAVVAGCCWTLCGGAGHVLFANPDWFVRDAVLHDLVISPWPVGYGIFDGQETLLRAPLGFYLPAAVMGKWAGLATAHAAMGLWTALGASLFLLQVLSLIPSSGRVVVSGVAVVVLFSGLDIIGNLISVPGFISHWNIAKHLEWWAGSYQYSSMTTQLFWVPNHALGGWLMIGLLFRSPRYSALDAMLPLLLVATALWSPLSAIGLVPFVLWRSYGSVVREHRVELLHPRAWLPSVAVGVLVAAYLLMDPSRIAKGISVGNGGIVDVLEDLLRQAQFFLLEAGFIGFAILAIRRSSQVILALVVLALLPLVYLGPGNDLVMRASIPSLAVLSIESCLVLSRVSSDAAAVPKKILLGCLLAVGAVTPIQEFARAVMLPSWPIDSQLTLIGTNCGGYPAHYVARLHTQAIRLFMKTPHRVAEQASGKQSCANPALFLAWRAGLHSD